MTISLLLLLTLTVSNAAEPFSVKPFVAWFYSVADTSHGRDTEHKWVRDYYQYRTKGVDRIDVDLEYALGKLTINANEKEDLISGYIRYYPDQIKPEVSYETFGSKGMFTVDISTEDDIHDEVHFKWDDIPWKDKYGGHVNNELNFSLPPALPMELKLDLGLGDADLDFSRLYLTDVNLNCGLSDVILRLDESNGVVCDRLSIDTGLGKLKAFGMQYLRAREVYIKVGLGSANLDFSGKLDQDVSLTVDVGLGTLELKLPRNANVRATIADNFLSDVDTDELVKRQGEWVSPTWSDDRPTIELDIDVGMGAVDLDFSD